VSVNKWRLWLGSGMGEVISHELAATMASLNGPERRRARRLVRRGEPAEDVVVARYAVAYARERQRRFQRSSFAFGLALGGAFGLAGIGLAIYFFSRAADARATTSAVLGALMLASSWRTWLAMRNVEAAERVNQEYLRRSGAPYSGWPADSGGRAAAGLGLFACNSRGRHLHSGWRCDTVAKGRPAHRCESHIGGSVRWRRRRNRRGCQCRPQQIATGAQRVASRSPVDTLTGLTDCDDDPAR